MTFWLSLLFLIERSHQSTIITTEGPILLPFQKYFIYRNRINPPQDLQGLYSIYWDDISAYWISILSKDQPPWWIQMFLSPPFLRCQGLTVYTMKPAEWLIGCVSVVANRFIFNFHCCQVHMILLSNTTCEKSDFYFCFHSVSQRV